MFDSISSIITGQLQNDFFSGGLALGTFAALAALLQSQFRRIISFLRRRYICTMVIDNRCRAFNWFVGWLASHPYSKSCKLFTVENSENEEGETILLLTPAPGLHYFWHRGRLLWLRREIDTESRGSEGAIERITIQTLTRDRNVLSSIMNDALASFGLPKNDAIDVHSYNAERGYWMDLPSCCKRPLDTVILPNRLGETLLSDAQTFLAGREWYTARGIPWRRGYLLYGPPGTGKTSTIIALASELDLDICIVNLASKKLDDSGLNELFAEAPHKSVMLVEDIDAVFTKRTKKGNSVGITFSGLLNVLDGVAGQEGHLLFMTTNHIELLDPALIRPGRIDVRVEVPYADRDQLRRIFLRFFAGMSSLAEKFSEGFEDKQITLADVQAHLLKFRDDPEAAVEKLQEIKVGLVSPDSMKLPRHLLNGESAADLDRTRDAAYPSSM